MLTGFVVCCSRIEIVGAAADIALWSAMVGKMFDQQIQRGVSPRVDDWGDSELKDDGLRGNWVSRKRPYKWDWVQDPSGMRGGRGRIHLGMRVHAEMRIHAGAQATKVSKVFHVGPKIKGYMQTLV